MVNLLEQALRELEAGEREAALGSLVDAWRANRAPAIADVIDTLSAEVTKRAPPFRPIAGELVEETWHRALATKSPAAYERMLEIIPRGKSPSSRLRSLLAVPPDPRFGPRSIAWLRKDPTPHTAGIFQERLVEVMNHILDIRTIAALTGPHAREMFPLHRDFMQDHIRRLLAFRERVLPAPDELIDRLKKAARPLPVSPTEDPSALYALVYANPDDDAARVVLADLLQQRDDPRGELIALQLARHGTTQRRSAREAELLTTWAKPWLGVLGDLFEEKTVQFDRGFVSHARFKREVAYMRWPRALRNAPEWSTLTHLDLGSCGQQQSILLSPQMRSLRHVETLDPATLVAVADLGPRAWESVGFHTVAWAHFQDAFERSDGATLLPKLKRASFDAEVRYSNARLETLETNAEHLGRLAGALPLLEEITGRFDSRVLAPFLRDPRAARIRKFSAKGERITLSFDRKARKATLRMQPYARDPMLPTHFEALTAIVRSGLVRRIDMTLSTPPNIDRWPPYADLAAAAAEHDVTLHAVHTHEYHSYY